MHKIVANALAVTLGLFLLAGCGLTGGPSLIRNISATVQNYSGPGGDLEAVVYSDADAHVIASGSIDSAGRFTIELPASLPDAQLSPVTEGLPPGLVISDTSARIAVPEFDVLESDTAVGYILLTSFATFAESSEVGEQQSVYIYSDRAVTITGTSDDGAQTANMSLREGWSIVTMQMVDTGSGLGSQLSSGQGSSTEWHIFAEFL